MPDDKPLEIDCKIHGRGIAAVVCGHVTSNNGTPLGFIENNSDPGDLQGWCYGCEYVYQQEKEMTEVFKAFNRMAVVCEDCYAKIKAKHNVNP